MDRSSSTARFTGIEGFKPYLSRPDPEKTCSISLYC